MTSQRCVVTDDGARLHVEIDDAAGPTVLLCHGYCLNLHSWDRQAQALAGRARVVRWDQRGHGRSTAGPVGSATLERLGADLERVVEAVAPTGPLVLVGHSMGGMTVMALAARRPDLFASRVAGVALVATSSGGLVDHDFGLGPLGRRAMRWGPPLLTWGGRHPGQAPPVRRLASRLTRRWSYARRVPKELSAFTDDMINATALEVAAAFMPRFALPAGYWSLAALAHLPVLVLTGADDLLIPAAHSERIAAELPRARLVVVHGAGHLVMLEHPDILDRQLTYLMEESGAW